MSGILAKYIAKKILGESAKNHFGKEDPYFETVPATRLNGKPKKRGKKRPKALPPGLSEHDAQVLTKVKRRAYRLDMSLFNFCGIRFGWGSVIGFVPAIGDVLDLFMSLMVVNTAKSIDGGLDQSTLSKMYTNVALDFLIGLVPFLGDIADALYRCNTRNAILLEETLRKRGARRSAAQGLKVTHDPSLPEHFDKDSDDERDPPPQYQTARPGRVTTEPQRPVPAKLPDEARGGGIMSAFGSKRQKRPDLESGGRTPAQAPARGNSQRLQKPLKGTVSR